MKTSILFLCTICCAGLFLFTGCFESYSCHLAEVKKIDSLQDVAKKLEGQLDAYRSIITLTSVPNDSASIMQYLEKNDSGPNRNVLISDISGAYLADIGRSFAAAPDVKTVVAFPVTENQTDWSHGVVIFTSSAGKKMPPTCNGCGRGIGPPPPTFIIIGIHPKLPFPPGPGGGPGDLNDSKAN